MTNALIHNARLIDPEAGTETSGWLRIEGGRIAEIGAGPRSGDIDCGGLCLAPGIVDVGVKVGEPGERHKESFRTAGRAAAAGGVTTIVTRPDTAPPIDTPEALEFVIRRARDDAIVDVRPMATLTKARAGRKMTEIGFLLDAGAVAFSDGDAVTADTRVLSRCLAYAKSLGALVIGHPQDPGLSAGAAVTSGTFAALRGLPAVPPMAERLGLERDLALAEMTGVRYHADQITTAAALPAWLLGRVAGRRVLDLCAAPGGKTMQLAAAGADVTALDVSERRMRRLHRNLDRTGLRARMVVGDAFDHRARYDAVLLDAPCSATGTIRRHPDLPFVKSPRDTEALTRLQMRLLDHAVGLVKPGGRLVYCACSLLPVEGEFQVRAALRRHDRLRVAPADPAALGGDAAWASPEGGLRLRPDHWSERGGLDGFYMAALTVA